MTGRIVSFLAAALLLLAQTPPAAAQADAGLGQARERLGLSPGQWEELRPILRAHFEAQRAILEKYGVDIGNRDAGQRSAVENMRELNEELRRSGVGLEEKIAQILSAAQMAELQRMQDERRERMREELLVRRLEEMGVELGLTEEQLARMKPVYLDHVRTQMEILEKHGIEFGAPQQGRRAGFRTLRRLRRDTNRANRETIERLTPILSGEQLKRYEAMQDEQRRQMRERIR